MAQITSPAALEEAQSHGTSQTTRTPDEAYAELEAAVKAYQPQTPTADLKRAYEFARARHGAQKRHSGDPYILHPLAVAMILTDLKVDMASLVAAILHDVVEDTGTSLKEIEKEFSPEIAELVDGLTKIGRMEFRSKQEKLAENFRKMVVAMAKDIRVILVKLADRLHNMRTLTYCPTEKRDRIAQETLDIYAPLAHRLGIYGVKSELEDLCLRQLKKEVYQELRRLIATKKQERQTSIDEVRHDLEAEMKRYGLNTAVVYGRPKHFFSIYKKMQERQLAFEEIHDLFAFRIIVETVKDCYEALGIVHAKWKPMSGRFKDYIAMPKANLYQSLHTTVVRPNGETAEIQIRTREMHEICEYGVAAHWVYKERKPSESQGPDLKKFSWMRQMIALQSELKDPDEFLEAVKVDLFDEEIFVFTPRGDVVELRTGASALDFAFAVHTDVGTRTIGCKVNGRMVPIKTPLASGDIVEILTSPNQKPSKDWLNMVCTSKARSKIRAYLRSEQREKSKTVGRELLEQALGNRDQSIEDLKRRGETDEFVRLTKESNFDDVLIAIGYGHIEAGELVAKAFPTPQEKPSTTPQSQPGQGEKSSKSKRPKMGVLVSGLEDVLVNLARCCNPLPGEDVVGFITRGRGVTVHRSSCSRALDMDPQRRVDVKWANDQDSRQAQHSAYLRVVARDRMGVLADITQIIASCGANIQQANVRVNQEGNGQIDLELAVGTLSQLQSVIRRIEAVSSVVSVERRSAQTVK